ncbi:MAG TPA: ABC transporter ATP-binding protein [Micromonosporaceae bacterium]
MTHLEFVDAPRSSATSAGVPDAVLDIRGLSVDYGVGARAVHAVSNVDLTVRRGEVLGIAGESGSGKSTLVYAITRLLRDPGVIVAGDATFYSRADASAPPRAVDLLSDDKSVIRSVRWSEIAVVFQSALHALNPVFTIGKLLDDVLAAHRGDMDKRARRERAAELLEMVGITADRLRSYPHELSGGMRQRVMIALSIALNPQLLIMDEPTTALDVVIQREILEQLMDLRDRLGFTVVFITHDLSLLIELADTIAVMYAGEIVERAPAQALFRAPRHPYTYGLLNSFPALHGPRIAMTGIKGSPPDLRHVPSGCPFHPRCAHAMPECATDHPPVLRLSDSFGDRDVSCWLQDSAHAVPPELALSHHAPSARVSAGPTADLADGQTPDIAIATEAAS